MQNKKVQKNIHITHNQERELKRLARETGLSESDIVRRALDSYFAERRKQISAVPGGQDTPDSRCP